MIKARVGRPLVGQGETIYLSGKAWKKAKELSGETERKAIADWVNRHLECLEIKKL